MGSDQPESVGDGGCSTCGGDQLVVHTVDTDPLKPNPCPDELRCLSCGQAQLHLAAPVGGGCTVVLASAESVRSAIAEATAGGWSVVMARRVPAGVELVLER